MYVCLCNGLTESDIHEFAAGGGRGVAEVYAHFGSRQCGSCETHIEETLRSAPGRNAPIGQGLAMRAATLAPNRD